MSTHQSSPNDGLIPHKDHLKAEAGEHGEFKRQENRFTTPFGEGPDDLPVEAGGGGR